MRFKGFLLILMLTILFYEPPAARAQSEDTVRIRTRMVFIDVLVKDKRTGAPVKDLDAENFEVFSDNKRRALTYFTREDSTAKRPLALALVLDLRPGGAGRYLRQPEIVKSLGRAVQKLPPEDEVAVLAVWVNGISGKSEVLTGFTRDRAKVSAALAVVPEIVGAYPKANVNRSECLNDSLDKIIPEVTNLVTPQQYNSHVVIVHISDGLNLLASAQRNQLAAELSKANLTFCALNCNKMKKVQAAIIAFTPLFAMAGISINGAEYIATQTGGEVVRVHEPEDYGKGLEKVIGDLTSRYALGFALDEQDPDDGRMHRIDVRVKARDSSGKERKLEALARRSYYLPKIQESAKHKEAAPENQNLFQTPIRVNRAEAEKAIRQVIYDLNYAAMTGDVETFKKLTAKRTLDLYYLTFDMILSKYRASGENYERSLADNSDELFNLIFTMVGVSFSSRLSYDDDKKKELRMKANAPIAFNENSTARIEWPDGSYSLAIFENGQWKTDDTETLKREILKSEILSPEEKEYIKKY